ncbi:MAG: type IV secretion system protein [Novosphingobium sp.]
MSAACDIARAEVGNGVAAALRGVDCVAGEMTQTAFGRLFGSGGALVPALTILLTLYVAFFAISLLTGRSRLGVSALTPRMMTLGLVLTFATSWVAYQSVVWNLATGAPDQIASIIAGSQGSATTLFADKIDIVFAAIAEATEGQAEASAGTFSPPNLLWLGAMLFLLGTVGVLVTSRIALAVLIAVGPAFVILALFQGTRGLFVGWLRAVAMLALAPLFAVLAGSLMLELAVPVIASLVDLDGKINPRAAMAFFLVGAVHVALMVLVMRTAGTMVAGWRIFGLAGKASDDGRTEARPASAPARPAALAPAPAASSPAAATARSIAISGVPASAPANDAGPGGIRREIRFDSRGIGEAPVSAASSSSPSRARGVGSRFRAPPARFTEKSR